MCQIVSLGVRNKSKSHGWNWNTLLSKSESLKDISRRAKCLFFLIRQRWASSRHKRDHWPWSIGIIVSQFDWAFEFSASHFWICASKHHIWISKATQYPYLRFDERDFATFSEKTERKRETVTCVRLTPVTDSYWVPARPQLQAGDKSKTNILILAFKSAKPHDKPQRFSHHSKLLQSAVIRYQDMSNYWIWKTMFFCVHVKAVIKPTKKLKAMQM